MPCISMALAYCMSNCVVAYGGLYRVKKNVFFYPKLNTVHRGPYDGGSILWLYDAHLRSLLKYGLVWINFRCRVSSHVFLV